MLQEANGAIRVICRCRPLSSDEATKGEVPSVTTPAHNALVLAEESGARTDVSFDAVFGVHATQSALYEVRPDAAAVHTPRPLHPPLADVRMLHPPLADVGMLHPPGC